MNTTSMLAALFAVALAASLSKRPTMDRARSDPLADPSDRAPPQPEFYHKVLVRGRDPRSFHQNAEVWRFANQAQVRKWKVGTGHNLFGVVSLRGRVAPLSRKEFCK